MDTPEGTATAAAGGGTKKKERVHHVPPTRPPPEAPAPEAGGRVHDTRTTPTPTEREIAYRKAVSMDVVDLDAVHALAFQGVPDAADLRPLFWKLLLGYLPPDRTQWASTLAEKRRRYEGFKQYATRLDGPRPEPEDSALDEGEEKAETKPVPESEEPEDGTRYVSKERAWRTYYRYDVSLEVIEKDVARTLPALHFFGDEETGGNAHGDALRSILFVYSRYNAAIRYVQGMNEVLAPIYYVFAHDPGVSRLCNQQPHRFICLKSSLSHITHHNSGTCRGRRVFLLCEPDGGDRPGVLEEV